MRRILQSGLGNAAILAGLLLAGCGTSEDISNGEDTNSDAARSIFQEDPAQGEGRTPAASTLPQLKTTLSFADGTPELTEAVRAELATILASPQVQAGGSIVLRGHTDSDGPDARNLETSRAMAEAARDFLVEGGVAAEQIAVIAFGEQNPVAPNALPDGRPNEEGRAANRRVELTVETGRAAGRDQTLIESLTEPAETEATGDPAVDPAQTGAQ